ncbi:histone-like nucleoid-structuring protein, MvaT/MvaU family [Pseudomonas sp. Marseille-Q5115]|uniref:histone-like nucleoid-structuring protein, MvaT/MvaU family n=1 Tax=Pseudomonas sp. Marseille-Q5115 TaxID=2866593 RepID=UPI001CE3D357|nr:histone-like nucleoid-structuring protein, MvaT/MvaU family [Pseudomonas sp. Marseille-Q5115]
MSKLGEYRELERKLAEQRSLLAWLQDKPELQKELEFEQQLRSLLGEYGKSLRDVRALLDPQSAQPASAVPAKRTRKARVVKRYRNPLTGEIVESKGGNHKLLGAWKARFGAEEVESWVQQ